MVNKHKTICNHEFCKACIDRWLETKNSCPCCRERLNDNEPEPFIDEWESSDDEDFEPRLQLPLRPPPWMSLDNQTFEIEIDTRIRNPRIIEIPIEPGMDLSSLNLSFDITSNIPSSAFDFSHLIRNVEIIDSSGRVLSSVNRNNGFSLTEMVSEINRRHGDIESEINRRHREREEEINRRYAVQRQMNRRSYSPPSPNNIRQSQMDFLSRRARQSRNRYRRR